jgi:hypothetical protein
MARVSMLVPAVAVVFACAPMHPTRAPVAAKPPAQPIAGPAVLEGEWRATDLDGWIYELSLHGEKYVQVIRRTTGGPCTQNGTLQSYETAYGQPYVPYDPTGMGGGGDGYGGATYGAPKTTLALVLTLQDNGCNPDYTGAQLVVLASDYAGDAITLRTGVGYGGAEESRRYERNEPPPVAKQP